MIEYLLKGFMLGFLIAAPVGQIGILCIRRTLLHGRTVGFVSGLGAATADAIFGAVAGFGLTAVSGFLVSNEAPLKVAGGLFLVYLGVSIFFERPPDRISSGRRPSAGRAYISTFFLTLANPSTIMTFAAVFLGIGVAAGPPATGNHLDTAALVAGVFAGSASWWFILSRAVAVLRTRLGPAWLAWVNRVSGGLLGALGVAALASLFP